MSGLTNLKGAEFKMTTDNPYGFGGAYVGGNTMGPGGFYPGGGFAPTIVTELTFKGGDTIYNLQDGTYTIEETKIPEGYAKAQKFEIVIKNRILYSVSNVTNAVDISVQSKVNAYQSVDEKA